MLHYIVVLKNCFLQKFKCPYLLGFVMKSKASEIGWMIVDKVFQFYDNKKKLKEHLRESKLQEQIFALQKKLAEVRSEVLYLRSVIKDTVEEKEERAKELRECLNTPSVFVDNEVNKK